MGLACSWSRFWVDYSSSAAVGGVEVVSRGSGSRRERFRLNRKTPAHLVGHQVHIRPRVWTRLHFSGHQMVTVLFFPGLVLGNLEMRRPTSPGLHG